MLTAEGAAAVDRARATHLAVVRAGFLEHFSREELGELAALLARAL